MSRTEFPPITKREDILPILSYIHFVAYDLCMKTFNEYIPNSGNFGLFAQTEEEYIFLQKLLQEITEPSNNPNQKYFKLIDPIVVAEIEDVPETHYEYIYFRKPDPSPYGNFLGDIDFVLGEDEYEDILGELENDEEVEGAELYEQPGVGKLIQMADLEARVVAYASTKEMTEKVRIRY